MENRGLLGTVQHVDPLPDESEEESELQSPLRGEISGNAAKRGEGSKLGEGWNREKMEGVVCPICFEAWYNGGEHYPRMSAVSRAGSCMECLVSESGLGNKEACPQCNTKCKMKDVRRIYGSRVIVHDDAELQMRVQSLDVKCKSLTKKDVDWRRKEAEWLRREAYLHMHLNEKKARKQGRFSGTQGSQEQSSVDNDAHPRDLPIEAELHLQ